MVAFLVAYASIAWLLRFVAHHTVAWFVPYRVGLGVLCWCCCAGVLADLIARPRSLYNRRCFQRTPGRVVTVVTALRPAYSQPDFLNSAHSAPVATTISASANG